jgi:glyoxylate carboligase
MATIRRKSSANIGKFHLSGFGLFDLWRAPDVIYDAFAAARAPRSGAPFIDVPVDVQLTRIPVQKRPAAAPQSLTLRAVS